MLGRHAGQHEVRVRCAQRHRLVEGAVLESCVRAAQLEAVDGSLPRQRLLHRLVGVDHLDLRGLRHQRLPAERAVGLEPGEGVRSLDGQPGGTDVALGPGKVAIDDLDIVDLEDLDLRFAQLECQLPEVVVEVGDAREQAVIPQTDRVVEVALGAAGGDVKLEVRFEQRPGVLEEHLVHRHLAGQAERLEHDVPGDADRAAALQPDRERVVSLAIG